MAAGPGAVGGQARTSSSGQPLSTDRSSRRLLYASEVETPAIELSRIPTIVVALIHRGDQLLLVEAQGPDDPVPVWMLPGGQVEEGEALRDALRRELAEETGLQIAGKPELAFEVEVEYRTDVGIGPYRALTFACEANGVLQPNDPDGLVNVTCPGRQPPASPTATASPASGER